METEDDLGGKENWGMGGGEEEKVKWGKVSTYMDGM